MRLYTLLGHSMIKDPEFGEFTVDEDGVLEVPEELGVQLHDTHVGGVKGWETEPERQSRLVAEEDARRRDPATLLAAVEELASKVEKSSPPAKNALKADWVAYAQAQGDQDAADKTVAQLMEEHGG